MEKRKRWTGNEKEGRKPKHWKPKYHRKVKGGIRGTGDGELETKTGNPLSLKDMNTGRRRIVTFSAVLRTSQLPLYNRITSPRKTTGATGDTSRARCIGMQTTRNPNDLFMVFPFVQQNLLNKIVICPNKKQKLEQMCWTKFICPTDICCFVRNAQQICWTNGMPNKFVRVFVEQNGFVQQD